MPVCQQVLYMQDQILSNVVKYGKVEPLLKLPLKSCRLFPESSLSVKPIILIFLNHHLSEQ